MKTRGWAIMLMFGCTLLTSTAQFFLKKGAGQLSFDVMSIVLNFYLFIGLSIYAIAAAMMILAFRGGEVSVLYPIVATSYIWVSIFSMALLGEMMNSVKWLGIAAIITGIALVGFGSRQQADDPSLPGVV